MLTESNGSPYAGGDAPKLRTACENCRQSKVKCNLSGKNVCTRCLRHGLQCQYGFANRSGKPKGSKNRATLRKLGQLQEDKPSMPGFRGRRIVPPVTEREPLVANRYPGSIVDPMTEEDVSFFSCRRVTSTFSHALDQVCFPGPPGFWESPRSFGSAAALETPICPSQLTAVDGSPFPDLLDSSCPTLPLGLGYPHTPLTPTFHPSDNLTDGIASPSFADSVSSPFPAAPCECVDMQLFHMHRLNHLLAESLSLRFDHSLQTMKATFCSCQMFLQCNKCTKDSPSLLLAISVLNLTLQLFEYWISRETSRALRVEHGMDIRYGYYEVCQEESRKIRTFLLRGLLLQCREVLSMLTSAVNAVRIGTPTIIKDEGSGEPGMKVEEASSQSWTSSEQLGVSLSDLDPEALSAGPDSNCLLPIIAGYEATVEAFLQSISTSECICGSKCTAVRDESV